MGPGGPPGPGWGPGHGGPGGGPGPGGLGRGSGPGGPGRGFFSRCFNGICNVITSRLYCLSCCRLLSCCFGGPDPCSPPF